jgi:hypothetical protein
MADGTDTPSGTPEEGSETAEQAPVVPAEKGWDGWENVQARPWFKALPAERRAVLEYGVQDLLRRSSLADLLRDEQPAAPAAAPADPVELTSLKESLQALTTERDSLKQQVEDAQYDMLDYRLKIEYPDLYEDFQGGDNPGGLYVEFVNLLQRAWERLPADATQEQVKEAEAKAATMVRALKKGQPKTPPQHLTPPATGDNPGRVHVSRQRTLKEAVNDAKLRSV